MARVRMLAAAGVGAVVAVAAVAIAALAWAATGRTPARPVASPGPFQAVGLLGASGDPEPSVDYYPDGAAAAIHWTMCAPTGAGACEPISSKGGSAAPGPEPAGTVFTITAIYQGRTYTSSLTWGGAPAAAAPPVLSGHARYGAFVTGAAARWTGGWGTEVDQLGIEACRSVRGTGCVMLSGDELQCARHGCGSLGGVTGPIKRPNRARVGNWYTGWYLFALDARLGNNVSGLVGYPSPAAIPPWPANATVIRSGPYGPVTGPPPPRVRLLADAQVHGNQVTLASVRCAVRCHVWITASLTAKRVASGRRVAWSASKLVTGTATIAVRGAVPRGRVAVAINVGDGPYLRGHAFVR